MIVETAKVPEVRSLYVSRSFGKPSLLIPWENITTFNRKGIEVTIGDLEPFETEPAEDVILLRDYVLDKKVIDLEENEVEVAYDIRSRSQEQETLCYGCRYRGKQPVSEGSGSGFLQIFSIHRRIPMLNR